MMSECIRIRVVRFGDKIIYPSSESVGEEGEV